jgi:hypothetical protein
MLKLPWRGPVVVLSTPSSVKVAELVPWIHHSCMKTASLEWECILDPASPCKITLWKACVLPRQDPASQETTGTMWHQPCSSHPGSWLVYARRKLEESPISPLRMSSFCVFFLLILVSSLPGDPQPWTMSHVCTLPERNYCYQNSSFPYLLLLCRHSFWVMHPQPYHLFSVLSGWSVCLF